MCPVLAFTPDVEAVLRWFDATHELVNADGRWWWRRMGYPGPGGAGDQDAWLFEALELTRMVQNDLARIAMTTTPKTTLKDADA